MNVTESVRKSRGILILPLTIIALLVLEIVAIRIVRESIADWRLQSLLQKRGIGAEAVVARLDEPAKGSSTVEYRFAVTASQGNKEEYYGYADIPGSEVDHFQLGTTVKIVYDPENPERSQLEDTPQNYSFVANLPIVVAALIGIVAIVGAGIRLLRMPGGKTPHGPGIRAGNSDD